MRWLKKVAYIGSRLELLKELERETGIERATSSGKLVDLVC